MSKGDSRAVVKVHTRLVIPKRLLSVLVELKEALELGLFVSVVLVGSKQVVK